MPTLSEIFDKRKILLYQNESLDLDHYYQEPYQDENDEIKEMGKPFETDESKKIRSLDLVNEDRTYSGFSYFMDGPLQFIRQDTGKPEFADMFYNVAGVSKSFDPMLPTSNKGKRGGTQIGAELLKLKYGQRTPVFLKENSKHCKFGCWYLRIRPKNKVSGPLEGIIKISTILNEISAGGGRYGK